MSQEYSMRVRKEADSPILFDNIENTSLFMSKNVVNKKTLWKHYLGITLIQKV